MTSKTIHEIFRFALSGGIALLVQLAILYLFTSVLGVWYLLSAIVAHACSIILNFMLQKFYVRKNYEMQKIHQQVSFFSLLALGYLVSNALCMYLLVSLFSWPYMASQFLIVLVLSIGTFYINRYFIFR